MSQANGENTASGNLVVVGGKDTAKKRNKTTEQPSVKLTPEGRPYPQNYDYEMAFSASCFRLKRLEGLAEVVRFAVQQTLLGTQVVGQPDKRLLSKTAYRRLMAANGLLNEGIQSVADRQRADAEYFGCEEFYNN